MKILYRNKEININIEIKKIFKKAETYCKNYSRKQWKHFDWLIDWLKAPEDWMKILSIFTARSSLLCPEKNKIKSKKCSFRNKIVKISSFFEIANKKLIYILNNYNFDFYSIYSNFFQIGNKNLIYILNNCNFDFHSIHSTFFQIGNKKLIYILNNYNFDH